MRPARLPLYVGALLMPLSAAAQNSTFTVESEMHARADSFACKETTELERLLQRNQSGAFSRLQQAADVLGVAVPFFFEGAAGGTFEPNGSSLSPAYIDDFVTTSDGLRLMKAFMSIRRAIRCLIVDLVNEVAGGE